MIKTAIALPALLLCASAHATCVTDSPELGDIGPASELICAHLERRSPDADIAIVERKIQSGEIVHVTVEVDGKRESRMYRLQGADWQPIEPLTAGIQ